jgi:hypothetical protein
VLRLRRGTNQGMASISYKVGEGGDGDVPLSAIDAVSTEETDAAESTPPTLGSSWRGELCGSRIPSISCISSLYASTFFLCLVCNLPAPLLRARSISQISLKLFEIVGGQGEG